VATGARGGIGDLIWESENKIKMRVKNASILLMA
jgi:hypothetical protein